MKPSLIYVKPLIIYFTLIWSNVFIYGKGDKYVKTGNLLKDVINNQNINKLEEN